MPAGKVFDRLHIRSGEELLAIAILGTQGQRHDVRRELDRRSRPNRTSKVGDRSKDADAA